MPIRMRCLRPLAAGSGAAGPGLILAAAYRQSQADTVNFGAGDRGRHRASGHWPFHAASFDLPRLPGRRLLRSAARARL